MTAQEPGLDQDHDMCWGRIKPFSLSSYTNSNKNNKNKCLHCAIMKGEESQLHLACLLLDLEKNNDLVQACPTSN